MGVKRLKIRISGFCQMGGISEAVKFLLPNEDVMIMPLKSTWPLEHTRGPGGPDGYEVFASEMSTIDVLLTVEKGLEDLVRQFKSNAIVLRWPQISFAGFHPDIALATSRGNDITSMGGCPYNSTIVLWCWLNRLSIDSVLKLFTNNVFKSFGYFNCWGHSADLLSSHFKECNLDFNCFFNAVKRKGVFMHSDVHASAYPIILLAKQLVKKIVLRFDVPYVEFDAPIERYLNDTLLFDAVWPVYPEIGDVLGVKGSYIWKYRSSIYYGLEEYVVSSYLEYDKQSIDRSGVISSKINSFSMSALEYWSKKLL